MDDAANKSNLKYLNIQSCTVGKVHNCWKTVCNNARDVRRDHVKVKLLADTYILQANRSKFNQYQVSPTCLLCGEGDPCSGICPKTELGMGENCECIYGENKN